VYRQIRTANNSISNTSILRTIDNSFIPFYIGNKDYQEYLLWIDQGNTPLPPDPIVVTEQDYTNAIQKHLDNVAKSKQYNDALSLASYRDSSITQWASEAATFISWRDSVWVYAYTELQKVQNQLRTQPTVEEFIQELPVIQW
jgi:hypothetical protein